jgi:hypothetical protein
MTLTPGERKFMERGDFADYLRDFMLDTGRKWHEEPRWDLETGRLISRIDTGDAQTLREFAQWLADSNEHRGEIPPRMRSGKWARDLRSQELPDLNAEAPEATAKEHNVIKAVDTEGIRRAVAYRRGENNYTHYPVGEAPNERKGIAGEGTKGLTHQQVLAKFAEAGHKPLYKNDKGFSDEPQTTKKAIAGYKDGKLTFAATPIKDDPAGKWKIVEGTDLEEKGQRTARTVDDYNDVIKARHEAQLSPTRRTSEGRAQLQDLEKRPVVNLVQPVCSITGLNKPA